MIWHLRVLTFYVAALLLSIAFFIAISIAYILRLSYSGKYKISKACSFCFILAAKMICGLNYKIYGESLPKAPAIVVANHQSFWDNIFMQVAIPEQSWVIKKQLLDIPFFGWGFRMLEPIAVNREDFYSVRKILDQGKEKLDQGLWLIIFPEASRLKPDQEGKFKPSAAKLSIMCNVPLVLIAHNAGLFWPKGFMIKKPGVIHFKIGPTIYPKDLDARQINGIAQDWINKEKLLLADEHYNT